MYLKYRLRKFLGNYAICRLANSHYKAWRVKKRYNDLCRRYGTPSALVDRSSISEMGRTELYREPLANRGKAIVGDRPRILFVGADWEQDRSGFIQALSRLADVKIFEREPGKPGQYWPESEAKFDQTRKHNGELLRRHIQEMEKDGPVFGVIGQMWGFTMYWRALAELRERGMRTVNISMDDRHAFEGEKLSDGTWSGTSGLLSCLDLACTDAVECLSWYRAEGCSALYLPEASDLEIFKPSESIKKHEVSFVGANYGIRALMVNHLRRAGINVAVYGNGWSNGRLSTDDVPRLFAESKIVLGCGTIGYCSDFLALKLRDFDGPMSGSLYMTHDNPDLHPLYENQREIVTFQDMSDMVSKVQHFLIHEDERNKIAAAGRTRAAAEHTWFQRLSRIFTHLQSSDN
jgi:spore maturation protein CgeB